MIGKMSMEKKFTVLSQKNLFQGYFRIDRYKISYQKFNGEWSIPVDRELFERGNAVAVLPYDPIQRKVILIEQFRAGAIHDSTATPWLFEIVAGIIEPGESLHTVAIRETQEEAGLTIKRLHPIYQYWASPGGCTEKLHLFCGIIDATNAGGIHGAETEQEDIKVHVLPINTAFEWLGQNKVRNATAIIALQWLKLHHHTL